MTLQKICCSCFRRSVGIFKNFSVICRVCKPQYAAISRETSKSYHRKEIWYSWFLFFLEMIVSCTTCWDLLRKKYRRRFAICLTTTDIFICSFNNNLLEKCTNGKAFNKVTTAHFLATLIQEHLVDFECFLRYIFNFMASKQPQQVSSNIHVFGKISSITCDTLHVFVNFTGFTLSSWLPDYMKTSETLYQ